VFHSKLLCALLDGLIEVFVADGWSRSAIPEPS
jgi:hypothetical protein